MEKRSRIRELLQRAWQATGGAVQIQDDSQPPLAEEESSEDLDDAYEPMPLWIKVFYGTIAVAIVIGIAAWFLKGYPDKYAYIQTVVLALTLVVVAIYTNLTRKMQQAMVRQTNVSILPVFEVEIILEGKHDPHARILGTIATQSRLELKNIGQGVALNVYIESLLVDCQGRYGGANYQPIKFEKLYSLSPNQKRIVKDTQPYDVAKVRAVGGLGRLDLLGLVATGRTFPNPELKIWFTDILGNKYVQIIHLGRHGITPDPVQLDKGQVTRTTVEYNKVEW